ncbi:MAG: cbb3-type cytochrome c oxidase subunit II [Alphaproteobacteria bacterium]|uniref:Cbb3-type cytochrome c oxidase subunit II n=1 Tax=Candidatus Nitrobium versatile TaxID=2884831 RepID=A0A953J3G7_9BACT|nr:cbb3-type cytochrome c oxidase subunit II [Candidatus Nitrobium versatile]
MAGALYKKPILFAVVVTIAVLVGTVVMMALPMLSASMHPKLAHLKPYTPLQLAGRDVYQEEGCFYCHTQTVRPLKAEVMRYGDYSKAGEFAYDQPFLWGSKRTGPDLARVGNKYTDAWHYVHFDTPQKLFPGSNMPSYGWLSKYPLNPGSVEARMKALGFPYTKEEIASLPGKSKLDALVAYMQSLGTAVARAPKTPLVAPGERNPLAGDTQAITEGRKVYEMHCVSCHGPDLKGDIAPPLTDGEWLTAKGPIGDDTLFLLIAEGTEQGREYAGRKAAGGMPPYRDYFGKKKIWSLVSYIRSMEEK